MHLLFSNLSIDLFTFRGLALGKTHLICATESNYVVTRQNRRGAIGISRRISGVTRAAKFLHGSESTPDAAVPNYSDDSAGKIY